MSDDFLFADETEDDEEGLEPVLAPGPPRDPWPILIVDDDPSIHAATRMVLRGVSFQDRPIECLSANSAAEARVTLRDNPTIALILLDVVMESDDAGLRLVHFIRNELGNRRVRIILRTGQPGQAPERDVILNYDINDYKSKTELTTQKLFTAVVAALRGFQDITAIEQHRMGLERVLNAAAALSEKRTMASFAAGVIAQLEGLLGSRDGSLLCSRAAGPGRPPHAHLYLLAGSGPYAALAGRPVHAFLPPTEAARITVALEERRDVITGDPCLMVFRSSAHPPTVFYTRRPQPITADELRLLELFRSKVGVGFDNAHLYEELTFLNRNLEQQVDLRTRELKAATRVAEAAREEAEAANQAKSLFLATMSHEIRTPMNGVQGMLELLEFTPLATDQRDLVRVVRESAGTLLTIINDILDFSKIEAGKLDLERVPLALDELVEGVGDTLAPSAAKKGLALDLFVDPAIPGPLMGDPVRLRQVLFNIAGNAVKFTSSGRISIRARLLSQDETRATIRLTVRDTGIGMSAEDQARLFRPFTQASSSTTRQFGGTGLGLSICRRLAELMAGEITVESELGQGSVFRFVVTMETTPDAAALVEPRLDGIQVLLTGHSDSHRRTIRSYLEAAGARVVETAEAPDLPPAGLLPEGFRPELVVADAAEAEAEATLAGIHASSAFGALPVVLVAPRPRFIETGADDLKLVSVGWPLHRHSLLRGVLAATGRHAAAKAADPAGGLGTGVGGTGEAVRLDIAPVEPPSAEEAERQNRLILVAEDHPVNRQVILRQLNLLGFAAEVVNDGRAALAAWRTGRFGLLITDCQMPEMDGFELARSIRRAERGGSRRLPILALTAGAMAEELQRCLEAGMDLTLTKPVQIAELKRQLDHHLPPPGEAAAAPAAAPKPPPPGQPMLRPPLDRQALFQLFGNDPSLIGQLLGEYRSCNDKIEIELDNALAERNWEDVRHAAHKLAGASRTVGAMALAQIGSAIETAVLGRNFNDVIRLSDCARDELRRVAEYIDAMSGPANGRGL